MPRAHERDKFRNGLASSFFGVSGRKPTEPRGYHEATLLSSGRRGRVLENNGETMIVELYASGDKETVNRDSVKLLWRDT